MTTTTQTSRKQPTSVVTYLRSLTPRRPLSFSHAQRIAELQAAKLLQRSGYVNGPVPEAIITELPRIDVQRSDQITGSGVSLWHRGKWRVRVNTLEPLTRQRFSIAHEFKHVLDAAHEDVIYRHLPIGTKQRHTHIEAICDAFAAALLMPKPAVKRLWYAGTHNPMVLAWHFQVSQQAMQIRLGTLGLIERPTRPRHSSTLTYRLGQAALGANHRPHGRRHYYRANASHVPADGRAGHRRSATPTARTTDHRSRAWPDTAMTTSVGGLTTGGAL